MKKVTTLLVLICSIIVCSYSNSYAQSGIITTVAGDAYGAGLGYGGYTGDGGPATNAELGEAAPGVAVDAIGNMYIPDENNNVIRKVDTFGTITTIAGTGIGGYSGDGGPATAAQLYLPTGVAVDSSGNVYIADIYNNVIRKVNTSGIISTVAGNGFGAGTGTGGYSGDGGPATAAELYYPWAVTIDGSGNMYICDRENYRIRKVNTSGVISTFAGTGTLGYSGDGGPATAAKLYYDDGIAIDGSGNVYIADGGNDVIRKVNSAGIISTFAGNHAGLTYTGDGGPATAAGFDWTTGVAVDGSGNVYITDYYNNVIRMVNTSGIVTTVAGNGFGAGLAVGSTGAGGYTGDGGPATDAELDLPSGIAVDAGGNIYIADSYNNVVRKVTFHPAIFIAAYPGDTVCVSTAVTYSATVTNSDTISYQWYVDNAIISGGTNSSYTYTPANGDSVKCICVNSSPTSGIDTLTSNTIYMVVNPISTDTLSMNAMPGFKVCSGTVVTYSVTGGAAPYQWLVNGSIIPGSTGSSYTYVPANGDSVRCATVAACNVGGSNTIYMIVVPIITPAITITASPTTTAAGSVVTVTATFSITVSYTINWYDNGILLGTTTTDSITYTKTSDTDHITATIVPVSGLPDCYDSATSNVVLVNDSTLGTTSPSPLKRGNISVWPNPAGEVLHIDNAPLHTRYAIVNLLGQNIQDGQIMDKTINIQTLQPGIFFIEITDEWGNIKMMKFIKM